MTGRNQVMGVKTAAILALWLVAGCDDSGTGTCQKGAACGGDIVGTWTITSSCLSIPPLNEGTADCPGLSGRGQATITGSVTYAADGTYQGDSTAAIVVFVDYPNSCLASAGITCAQLSEGVAADIDTTEFSSGSCAPGSGACTCTLVVPPMPSHDTGTYSTSGSVLTEVDEMGERDQIDYCVAGTTLTESVTAMPMGASMPATGTIVLKKN